MWSFSESVHGLLKEDVDWVKKCMEYEVEGSGQRQTTETSVGRAELSADLHDARDVELVDLLMYAHLLRLQTVQLSPAINHVTVEPCHLTNQLLTLLHQHRTAQLTRLRSFRI